MPLSKAKMRERKRRDRGLVKPMSNLNATTPVKPNIKMKLAGLKMEGNRIIGVKKTEELSASSLPLYNPAVHKPGDTVLIQQGKRLLPTTIPELDGEGNAMPDYS